MNKITKQIVKIKYLLLIVFLALAFNCKNKDADDKPENNISNTLTKVKVQKITMGSSSNKLTYNGNVIPVKTTPLSFLLPGTVKTIKVDEGDWVNKGQILAELDNTSFKNAYQGTLASEKQAQDAYNRLKTVHDKGSLPEIKWQEITAKLQQAKSANKIAYQNISNTILRAPSKGFINKRNIEVGESAITGVPILSLVSIYDVYVEIAVPENEINKFNKNLSADITIPALGSEHFIGKVDKIGVVANTISKTYNVKIKVVNKKGIIKPGMACDVSININSKEDVIVVPYQSIIKDNDKNNYVFIVDPNSKIVSQKKVQLGSFINNKIEIISGISIGDLIVIDGKQKIANNQKVTF